MLTYIFEGDFNSAQIWDILEDYFVGKIPQKVKAGGGFIKKADDTIILDTYKKYPNIIKITKSKKMPLKKQLTIRKELQARIDRVLFHLKSETTLLSEREKLITKGKVIYQQYVEYSKSNPEMITQAFENSMNQLLEQMAKCEAEFVDNFRLMETGGKRIDLEALMKEGTIIKQLMHQKILTLLENALSDTDFTMVSQSNQNIYITESGSKYHIENCVYCKGRKLIPVSIRRIENLGLTPCKCMEHADKVLEKEIAVTKEHNKEQKDYKKVSSEQGGEQKKHKTVTIFIDESVRENLWKKWDDALNEKQGSFSYIICKGHLRSENEITEENTYMKNASLLTEIYDTNIAAIEAISTVLMKVAFGLDFHDDVIIYTDNTSAKNRWYKNKANGYLSKFFNSVTVIAIPREKNTVADQIGRQRAFADIPVSVMQQLIKKCDEYDKLANQLEQVKHQLDFVKEYFPYPEKQIPNLISELRLLAGEK